MRRLLVSCPIWATLWLSACGAEEAPDRVWSVAAQGLYAGAISEGGDLIVAGSMNHGASLWRSPEHERIFNWSHAAGEYVELVAADFSPDASHAITTDPRTLVLWDTASGSALNYWGTPGAVLDVAVFGDNRRALLGLDDHSALVFDARTGAYERTLLHEGNVNSVDVSSQGDVGLTGSDDGTAVLWDLNTGETRHTLRHDNPVRAVALSADGRLSFTAAQDDLVAIWDNASGSVLHELNRTRFHGIIAGRFSADGRLLAVGHANRKVVLYDVASGREIERWDPGTRHRLRATGAAIVEVGFRDTAVLALTGDGRLLELRPG